MDKNRTQRSEKIEEENRIKKERQKLLQQNKQSEDSNDKNIMDIYIIRDLNLTIQL